jgi:hypothetical protein
VRITRRFLRDQSCEIFREVLIISGECTAIDFFIPPIIDRLRRSFREA